MWKWSKCRKAEICYFGLWDFLWCAMVAKAVALGVPRTSHAAEVRVEYVSNVIYQKVYLFRLINVSDILSN
jgi:hypothetical protein